MRNVWGWGSVRGLVGVRARVGVRVWARLGCGCGLVKCLQLLAAVGQREELKCGRQALALEPASTKCNVSRYTASVDIWWRRRRSPPLLPLTRVGSTLVWGRGAQPRGSAHI